MVMILRRIKPGLESVTKISRHVPSLVFVMAAAKFSSPVKGDFSKCPDETRPNLDTKLMSWHQQVVVFAIPEKFEFLSPSKQLHCTRNTDQIPNNGNHGDFSQLVSHPLVPCTSNNPSRMFFMDKSARKRARNGCTYWFECNIHESVNSITVTLLDENIDAASDVTLTFDFVEILIATQHQLRHFKDLLLCFELSSTSVHKPIPWYPKVNLENTVYFLGVIIALYLVYLLWKSSENEPEELEDEHVDNERKTDQNPSVSTSTQGTSDLASNISSPQSLANVNAQRKIKSAPSSQLPKLEQTYLQRPSPTKAHANNRHMPKIHEEKADVKNGKSSCPEPLNLVDQDGSFLKMSRSVYQNSPSESLEMLPIPSQDQGGNHTAFGRLPASVVPTFGHHTFDLDYQSRSSPRSLRHARYSIDVNMPSVSHPPGRGKIIRRTSVPYAGGNAYSYLRTSHC